MITLVLLRSYRYKCNTLCLIFAFWCALFDRFYEILMTEVIVVIRRRYFLPKYQRIEIRGLPTVIVTVTAVLFRKPASTSSFKARFTVDTEICSCTAMVGMAGKQVKSILERSIR